MSLFDSWLACGKRKLAVDHWSKRWLESKGFAIQFRSGTLRIRRVVVGGLQRQPQSKKFTWKNLE
jgi:hypothetical protein